MFKTLEQDRPFIENKFHIVGEPFKPLGRWNYHGYAYDESTGLTDEQIQEGLKALSESIKNESHPVQKGKCFAYVLDNTRIDINEHDYFIGMWTWARPLTPYCRWGWETEKECPEAVETLDKYEYSGVAFGRLDYDHTVPDWDSLLELGFPGILQRLHDNYNEIVKNGGATQKQTEMYKGCVIAYESIVRFIDRLYKYALTKTHAKAKTYAECLKNLRDGAPTNTYEALQLIWLYFFIGEHIDNYQVRSLGFGLDSSVYPFFKKDMESGKFTKEEIREFLAYFYMQFSAIGNYWNQPMYLGGRNRNGNTRVNELSYIMLDVYDKLDIHNPKIQIRVANNTPKDFVYQALKMVQTGNKSLVFCNDEMITKCLMSKGATYEDAMDSLISGCYEYGIKDGGVAISGNLINVLKAVSLVLENGYDSYSQKQVSIKTGELEELKTFKDFYNAFLAHIEYTTDDYLTALNKLEPGIADINPSLLFSGASKRCSKTMTDALDNGLNNGSGISLSGLGTAVDALMVVEELVYNQKIVTLQELKKALDNNWVGYEALRHKALNCCHKYGRGDEKADNYAASIVRFYHKLIANRKNAHNCGYGLEIHSARGFISHGLKTLATPDGRRAGEETSKNASAHPGMDKNGVTALINSATTIDTSIATTGFCLDVTLHPTSVQGDSGVDVLYGVMRTYMDKGGQSIQFNVFDADLLRDAQAHPEKYENLQVRVCGWNVLWNNMPKSEQDMYILRAENLNK